MQSKFKICSPQGGKRCVCEEALGMIPQKWVEITGALRGSHRDTGLKKMGDVPQAQARENSSLTVGKVAKSVTLRIVLNA